MSGHGSGPPGSAAAVDCVGGNPLSGSRTVWGCRLDRWCLGGVVRRSLRFPSCSNQHVCLGHGFAFRLLRISRMRGDHFSATAA